MLPDASRAGACKVLMHTNKPQPAAFCYASPVFQPQRHRLGTLGALVGEAGAFQGFQKVKEGAPVPPFPLQSSSSLRCGWGCVISRGLAVGDDNESWIRRPSLGWLDLVLKVFSSLNDSATL